MIKKNFLFVLVMAAITSMQACTSNNTGTSAAQADSTNCGDLAKAFEGNGSSLNEPTAILDQPVNFKLAMACVEKYKTSGINPAKKTEYVEFSKPALGDWLAKLPASTKFNSIRIYMGIYTQEILKEYTKPDTLEGKLTVFLFPYLDDKPARYNDQITTADEGEPVDPFNLGEVHP